MDKWIIDFKFSNNPTIHSSNTFLNVHAVRKRIYCYFFLRPFPVLYFLEVFKRLAAVIAEVQ